MRKKLPLLKKLLQKNNIVPLARILKPHGFSKRVFKADLFNPGGAIFQTKSAIFIQPPDSPQAEWQSVVLAELPSPMGAKWGQAKGLLLHFTTELNPEPRGFLVGLPREDFPALAEAHEVYLADVWGFEIEDEDGKKWGHIGAYEVLSTRDARAFNIQTFNEKGEMVLDFPWAWIEAANIGEGKILVPQASIWNKLV